MLCANCGIKIDILTSNVYQTDLGLLCPFCLKFTPITVNDKCKSEYILNQIHEKTIGLNSINSLNNMYIL